MVIRSFSKRACERDNSGREGGVTVDDVRRAAIRLDRNGVQAAKRRVGQDMDIPRPAFEPHSDVAADQQPARIGSGVGIVALAEQLARADAEQCGGQVAPLARLDALAERTANGRGWKRAWWSISPPR
jgi:hypothetical protein